LGDKMSAKQYNPSQMLRPYSQNLGQTPRAIA